MARRPPADDMAETFFDRPIVNSPYAAPTRHWELDADGQPTNRLIEARRRCDLVTPETTGAREGPAPKASSA